MTLHEETDELARSESGPPIGCRLLVTAGDEDDVGRSVALMRGTAFIGRSSDCELPLKDGRVSRRHVSLAIDHGGITVEDLRSRNGTFYLGSRIERARVPHGASITVGDTTIALLPLAMNDLAASSAPTSYGDLVGESLAMRRVFATLTRLEASDVNVVIVGESGTGKERIARIVHKKSRRTEGPFVAVTCSGADEEGLLHELAGRSGRPGAFERADGGTLYLEDVDALPAPLQTLLARVLEHNEYRRAGEQVRRRVNVRVIASSQRALDGTRLRTELEQRLAVVMMVVPPLRERPEDIKLIAAAIANTDGKGATLGPAELAHLGSQPWPGNLRELRAAVLRTLAVGLEAGARPTLIANESTDTSYKGSRERIVTTFEAQYVADLLQRHDGNVSAAAREAKISRKHLHELLRRHRIPT